MALTCHSGLRSKRRESVSWERPANPVSAWRGTRWTEGTGWWKKVARWFGRLTHIVDIDDQVEAYRKRTILTAHITTGGRAPSPAQRRGLYDRRPPAFIRLPDPHPGV